MYYNLKKTYYYLLPTPNFCPIFHRISAVARIMRSTSPGSPTK